MPDLIPYIELWAPFLILMVVLYIVYKVAMKFSSDNINLKRENSVLERADRNREWQAHIDNMSTLVKVITDWQKENNQSNDEHSSEHKQIVKILEAKEANNNKDHIKMLDMIETTHNSVKVLNSDINRHHGV